MSDSGFVDEALPGPERPARRRAPAARRDTGTPPETSADRQPRRRRSPVATGFVVLVVGLLAFGGYAWSGRVHADDVAAYEALARDVEELDRTMTPLGHSEIPPCRDTDAGRVTRTYPPSTGPQAAELVGYLEQKGWRQEAAVPPAVAHLTRAAGGHVLTVDVTAGSLSQLVASLTAASPASSFGCLLH